MGRRAINNGHQKDIDVHVKMRLDLCLKYEHHSKFKVE